MNIWYEIMKTKDDAIRVLRNWYGDIADLQAKYKLAVLMRVNASEYKFEEIMLFLDL